MFDRAYGLIALTEGGAVATRGVGDGAVWAAVSKVVMRSGRHFNFLTFGVIWQDWDVEGGADAFEVDGHCFYRTSNGTRFPGNSAWEGIHMYRPRRRATASTCCSTSTRAA